MSQLPPEYKTRTLYGISAAELHERIVVDLAAVCEHWGIRCRAFEEPDARPLEQTIRMVIMECLVNGRGGVAE